MKDLQVIPLETNRAIALMKIGGEYRIDSRIVAKGIGVQHEAFIRTLRKYQNRLERLGVFRFENGKPPKGTEGGRPEIYVMLNKNQAAFAITLSRNTEQVVDFKFDLIEAFDLLVTGKVKMIQPSVNHRSITPAQERDLALEYVHHCWRIYGKGVTSAKLRCSFLKRFTTPHLQQVLETLAYENEIEQYFTPHAHRGKFRPIPENRKKLRSGQAVVASPLAT